MQSRAIHRLAKKLRSTHRKTKSWKKTAIECNITGRDGSPSKALAYQIAMNDFEPSDHGTLIRLGLPCECDQCKQQKRLAKRAAHQDLFDMPTQAVLEALNNRQTFDPHVDKKIMNAFIRACQRKGALVKVRAS